MKQLPLIARHLSLYPFLFLFVLISVLLFSACKEKNDDRPPSVKFLSGNGYIAQDAVLKAGSQFLVGIDAVRGDNDLTNFQVRRAFDGKEEVIMDTGIHNEQFVYSFRMSKGVYSPETWYFRIMDEQGAWNEVSFVLTRNPGDTFDLVRTLPSVVLGAQQCTSAGSFLDLTDNVNYFQDQAYLLQDSIEMLYYYINNGEGNTIASPKANIDPSVFTGASGVLNWTVRNETRYFKTTLSPAVFDAVVNDSLPIIAFDLLHSHRKAKNLVPGDVYSFRTIHMKHGLFKVVNVNGTETGTVEVSIKMQP